MPPTISVAFCAAGAGELPNTLKASPTAANDKTAAKAALFVLAMMISSLVASTRG